MRRGGRAGDARIGGRIDSCRSLQSQASLSDGSRCARAIAKCGKLGLPSSQRFGIIMALTLDTLQAEVMKLSSADRTRLLDALLDCMDEDEETERAWEQVADHRDAELNSGAVEALDGPSVVVRLRARFPG